MNPWNMLGIAAGLTVAGFAIQVGDPSFFTSEHVEIWHEHLAARGLLLEPLPQPEPFARGAHSDVAQWGY